MVMTSVSGHLLNYEFSPTFKNWQSCNPIALFNAPIYKNCPQDYQNIKVYFDNFYLELISRLHSLILENSRKRNTFLSRPSYMDRL